MQKRGLQAIFTVLIVLAFSISFVIAQDNSTNTPIADTSTSPDTNQEESSEESDSDLADITQEEANNELGNGGSINEFDRFIDGIFKDDEAYSRERAAEIKTLLSEGRYEEAKALLAEYEQSAERFEKEVAPEDKADAERRSKVIRKAYGDIINDVPAEYRDEFNKINVLEKKIETAAEIADKIKELCETLATLDPDQYSRTCKTGDDSPDWQKRMDKKLTEEQKKEVKNFMKIMTECLKDATNCKCGEISVTAFADKCSEVAPLYAECQKGDETKCEEADSMTKDMGDLLPDYLQEAMQNLEEDFQGTQMENHMPQECKEAGVKTPKECQNIMIRLNAPEECLSAMDSGELKFESERQFRTACEEIMFKANAPQECIDAGIKDGKECGKFMFKQSAPQECIDAGLTGASSSDGRKCQEIMKKFDGERREGEEGKEGPGGRSVINFDCRQITNAEERLKCFDSAVSNFKEGPEGENREFNEEEFRNIKEMERQCADSCTQGAWDFTGGRCVCKSGQGQPGEFSECKDGCSQECPGASRTDCADDGRRCVCFYEERREEQQQQQQQQPQQQQQQQPQEQQQQPQEQQQQQPSSDSGSSSSGGDSGSSSDGSSSSSSGSSDSSSGSSSSGGDSSSSGSSGGESSPPPATGSVITGNVISDISNGNGFLSYFFGK